ncbi:hypothetical protein F5Y05DRAFT_155676 [Hypoxylon sp. FL0543]|nr:hypothetical protein F5Y05DRAFT_155676 [Hypoxylon sp. FL0543]
MSKRNLKSDLMKLWYERPVLHGFVFQGNLISSCRPRAYAPCEIAPQSRGMMRIRLSRTRRMVVYINSNTRTTFSFKNTSGKRIPTYPGFRHRRQIWGVTTYSIRNSVGIFWRGQKPTQNIVSSPSFTTNHAKVNVWPSTSERPSPRGTLYVAQGGP